MKRIPRAFLVAWLLCFGLGMCFATSYRLGAGKVRDFRSFQAAGYLVLHEPGRLYDLSAQQAAEDALDPPSKGALPFYHLPYEALLFAPLAFFRPGAAYPLSFAVNLLLLLGCVACAPGIFGRVIPFFQPRAGLAVFLFVPVFWTLLQGQDSLLLLLICCLTLRALERDEDALAGAILALALFKFEIALPLALLIAVRRGWLLLAGFIPAGLVLLGLSAALIGRRGVADLRALLSAGSLVAEPGGANQAAMAIHPAAMPNVMGFVFTLRGPQIAGDVTFLVVLVLSALTMILGMAAARRARNESEAYSITILCAVLVSYHLYLHDATLLLMPICMWGNRLAAQVLLLAPLVLILSGSSYLYLLAVPILWLLVAASEPGSRAALAARGRPIRQAGPVRPTPETGR